MSLLNTMDNIINIYCDESCHLENDRLPVMLVGGIWCPRMEVQRLSRHLRDLKKHFKATGELKWTKVSASRENFYEAVLDWFFNEPALHFRAIVVTQKHLLNHSHFNEGSHDTFYYKLYFSLLSKILSPDKCYNIYLDIKDTRSRIKLHKLTEVLCNNVYDFTNQMIKHIQNIHSKESEIMQIADLLLGAIAYRHRSLTTNSAKLAIVNYLEQKQGYNLLKSTSLQEEKFNIFLFTPQQV